MNVKNIAAGLKLILGKEVETLPATQDDIGKLRTIKEMYTLEHFVGMKCPHCDAIGSISRISFSTRVDMGLSLQHMDHAAAVRHFGYLNDGGALVFERNPLVSDHESTEVIIANQDEVRRHASPWLCIECGETTEPTEFVSQLNVDDFVR